MSSLAARAPVEMQRLSPLCLLSALWTAMKESDHDFPAYLVESHILRLLCSVMNRFWYGSARSINLVAISGYSEVFYEPLQLWVSFGVQVR